ncbi:MAG: iron-sulfur cluster assembly protein [Candidatus Aenigmatarchaeota archaeon]|nr:iron-sulfur cluster assembly protein [Candidatus Aenigmarchaeota archaeon]
MKKLTEIEKIKKILDEIKDPHTNIGIVSSKMIENISIKDKKVKIVLKPPYFGCVGCGFINVISNEIKEKLKKNGFESEIELVF